MRKTILLLLLSLVLAGCGGQKQEASKETEAVTEESTISVETKPSVETTTPTEQNLLPDFDDELEREAETTAPVKKPATTRPTVPAATTAPAQDSAGNDLPTETSQPLQEWSDPVL